MTEVKYPEIVVQLTGTDGNAMSIIGRVTTSLRKGGVGNDEINAFATEAMSGDYDNVLATAMRWVDVS
jgi:hypothetical protein